MPFIVPPGGHAGFAQMTPASRRALFPGGQRSSSTGRKRRRRRKSKYGGGARGRSKSPYTRALKRKSKGPKFGSPAFNKKHGVGQFRKK